MDSTDDNAVTNEPEIRRTRSGRAVRPPPAPAPKQTPRKTRKKMVLVEVEVSEEEEDINEDQNPSEDKSVTDLNSVEPEVIKTNFTDEFLTSKQQENVIEDDNTPQIQTETLADDSNSVLINEFHGDSSIDQNDSRSIPFNSKIDSELHSEQNSNQETFENVEVRTENQDSLQTENSTTDVPEEKSLDASKEFNAAVLNTDSQTQCKPDEKESEIDNRNGVSFISVRSVSSLFDSSEIDIKKTESHEPMETDVVEESIKEQVEEKDVEEKEVEEKEVEEKDVEEKEVEEKDVDEKEVEEKDVEEKEVEEELKKKEIVETSEEIEDTVEEKVEKEKNEIIEEKEKIKEKKQEKEDIIEDEPMEHEPIKEKLSEAEEEEEKVEKSENKKEKQGIDQDTEVISEDELPQVQAAKVPETEEVSDEELPGPKLAELPADTEVVSEDELPTVKKEGTKRKLEESEYDPGSPTSESEQSAAKKPAMEGSVDTKKEEKPAKPRKLPELDKYWKAVNDDPTDFTGWTYLLQYVDQENDMEAAREAYDAFLSHYPYCYGYWRKYADYEKRKGNKKKCEEVFERGLKAIPLSVDLWLHYLNYTRSTHADEEDHIRAQYERALAACGLEFRSDRLWDGYIKWETEGKRLQQVTMLYDRLLATPTQGYTNHFDNFQEHVASHAPNKILEVDEFLALRKEIRHMLKHDVTTNDPSSGNSDTPPGEGEQDSGTKTDEETTALKERIVSIRRKIHKGTVNAVTARWNFEEGIKRPYFHVKPLERCQLKNWKEYLDYEIEQGDQARIIVLFERCLIACALYEEFWLRFVHYLENLNDPDLKTKIRDVYERACTIHHLNKPSLHLQWAMFEECSENYTRAAEILVNLEKPLPNLLQVAYRRINLERRRNDLEKCSQLYEQYIANSKNKLISTNLAIKYARFCLKICKNVDKSFEVLNKAIEKDPTNPRLYLQLIDLTLQKDGTSEKEVLEYIDQFLGKDGAEIDQKVLFAQRKLEFLEDFGSDIKSVQKAYDDYQKYCKLNKDKKKKEEAKGADKKAKDPPLPSAQSSSYNNYGTYSNAAATTGASSTPASYTQYSNAQPTGQYGSQYGTQYSQNDQYQYQNWQYSQSGYGSYGNQWGSYGNYY